MLRVGAGGPGLRRDDRVLQWWFIWTPDTRTFEPIGPDRASLGERQYSGPLF